MEDKERRTYDWKDLIDRDFPEFGEVTEETVNQMQQDAMRYGGSARVAMGRVWTTEAYEERRKRVHSTPLP